MPFSARGGVGGNVMPHASHYGATIVQVPLVEVCYWHVELDRHDVLLAEGLPAESYPDTGNRAAFENGAAFIELHPDFLPRHSADTCARLVTEGPAIAAVKARLQRRAQAFGHRTTKDGLVRIVADGRVLAPDWSDGNSYRFDLPAGAADVRLVSRVWVPAHMLANSTDRRTLGVCARRLIVDGRAMSLDGAGLNDGWHTAEADAAGLFRWTAGSARLPPTVTSVAVDLIGEERSYWLSPHRGAQAVRSGHRSVGCRAV